MRNNVLTKMLAASPEQQVGFSFSSISALFQAVLPSTINEIDLVNIRTKKPHRDDDASSLHLYTALSSSPCQESLQFPIAGSTISWLYHNSFFNSPTLSVL